MQVKTGPTCKNTRFFGGPKDRTRKNPSGGVVMLGPNTMKATAKPEILVESKHRMEMGEDIKLSQAQVNFLTRMIGY